MLSLVLERQKISAYIKTNASCSSTVLEVSQQLEKHYKDMQDIEFTIENEQLYVLQTGKRTANAAIHIAVDLVEEGIISKMKQL